MTPWNESAEPDSEALVVLLVDPDPVTADQQRVKLALDGYDVRVTTSGLVDGVEPDLIVVHLHQGRADCVEALEALERSPDVRRRGLVAIDAGDDESALAIAALIPPEHHALRTRGHAS